MRERQAPAIAGFILLAVSIVRTAWVADDSYITFRVADNLVHGYGPVWNTTERVQAFTHPLWLAVFTPFYAITREPYYTSMALGALLTIVAVWLLVRRVAISERSALVCLAALLSSKAFIDFSTSGLENALTHVVLVAFLWEWWNQPVSSAGAIAPASAGATQMASASPSSTRHGPGTAGPRRMFRLSLLAALAMLNRADLALLVGPPLALEVWRQGLRRSFKPALLGTLPLIAWECFSAFYYGSFVPNTAYAKLNLGFPMSELLRRGADYYHRTLFSDPVTLPMIALGVLTIPRARWRTDWPLAAGLLLGGFYILRIGGDFMAGRFFTAPFVWSLCLIARATLVSRRASSLIVAAACLILGLLAPWEPAILSGYGYSWANNLLHGVPGQEPLDHMSNIYVDDVMDERRYYYESSGLLKTRPGQLRPDSPLVVDGLELRRGADRLVVRDGIGFTGYFAGPNVHIVDTLALSDPLLARLPAQRGTRTGHYRRGLPAGYLESLASGTNLIEDQDLAFYYDRLRLVVSGPLFSRDRLTALAALLSGRHDNRLNWYSTRHPPG